MNYPFRIKNYLGVLLVLLVALAASGTQAATTDLGTEPLAQAAGSMVKPNLLFTLDNSGSMAYEYLPDYVGSGGGGGGGCSDEIWCYSHDFNRVYYDPNFSYTDHRPVNADKTLWRNFNNAAASAGLPSTGGTGLWTAVPKDAFLNGAVANLTASFKAVKKYCSATGVCLPVGGWGSFSYANPFVAPAPYNSSTTTNNNVPAFYFSIAPKEYCTSETLTTCTLATSPITVAGIPYNFPAPVRFCNSTAAAAQATAVTTSSGVTPICQALQSTTYKNPRFGTWTRVDIVPTTATYGNRPDRTDCASRPVCTYAEEMTNFANWYAYYPTRLAMMKSSAGRAFRDVDDNTLRVGFITINPASSTGGTTNVTSSNPVLSTYYLPIGLFNSGNGQRTNWYTKFYAQSTRGSTPLREALSRAGRYYAGKHDYINSGMADDPVEYACQANYVLLTTDGYWNDGDGKEINGTTLMQNWDGQDQGYSTRLVTAYDAWPKGSTTTSITTTTGATNVISNLVSSRSYTVACSNAARPTLGVCNGNEIRVRLNGNTAVTLNAGDKIRVSGSQCSTAFSTVTNAANLDDPLNFVAVTSATVSSNSGNLTFTYPQVGSGSGNDSVCVVDILTQSGTTTTTSVTMDGTANTLADAAMYYYKTDLRPQGALNAAGTDVSANVVPSMCDKNAKVYTDCNYPPGYAASGKTPSNDKIRQMHQHMVTYTLGLVDGSMMYKANYPTATSGDFYSITTAKTGCLFSPTTPSVDPTCDWPTPVKDTPAALDDLWHAAVNGRGQFYHAANADELETGILKMLNSIGAATGAAAASATSSPNLSKSDNFQFSATYRTLNANDPRIGWDGEVVSNNVDPYSGNTVYPNNWSAQQMLNQKITSHTTDTRAIYMYDNNAANGNTKPFLYANMTAREKAYFDNQCNFIKMSQCSTGTLSATQISEGNNGVNLVNYLRGQTNHQVVGQATSLGAAFGPPAGEIYRARDWALGDVVSAEPLYIRQPPWHFNDTGYWNKNNTAVTGYKEANFGRKAVVYIAANDGMLHALDAGGCTGTPGSPVCNSGNGKELWAYVPSMVLPNLYKLADWSYTYKHQYFVDGSPRSMDVQDGSGNWHTILVGGLNGGGRGYYALDVTNPDPTQSGGGPKVLWEFCSDTDVNGVNLCSLNDADLGYSYGLPVIMKRPLDGKWVVLVTSGYNNCTYNAITAPNCNATGNGGGYLYVLDALTGTLLNKVATGVGTNGAPSGLAQISNRGDSDGDKDQTSTYVYGGDLYGNVFRFDFSVNPPSVITLAQLTDPSGLPQPITVRPELGSIEASPGVLVKAVFVGTGKYLGSTDLTNTDVQSLYGFRDGSSLGKLRTRTAAPGKMVHQALFDTSGVRSMSGTKVDWTSGGDSGWYFDFYPNSLDPSTLAPVAGGIKLGEKVNTKMSLIAGVLGVNTNVPPSSGAVADPCAADSAAAWNYQLDYKTGLPVKNADGTIAISKVLNDLGTSGMMVGENIFSLASGRLVAKIRLSTGKEVIIDLPPVSVGKAGKISWKELSE